MGKNNLGIPIVTYDIHLWKKFKLIVIKIFIIPKATPQKKAR
jgi:hypothetical protein